MSCILNNLLEAGAFQSDLLRVYTLKLPRMTVWKQISEFQSRLIKSDYLKAKPGIIIFFKKFILFYVCGCLTCTNAYAPHAARIHGGQKNVLDPLRQELYVVVSLM